MQIQLTFELKLEPNYIKCLDCRELITLVSQVLVVDKVYGNKCKENFQTAEDYRRVNFTISKQEETNTPKILEICRNKNTHLEYNRGSL